MWDVIDLLGTPRTSVEPLSMEDVDGDYGFVNYHTTIWEEGNFWAKTFHHRGLFFNNKTYVDTIQRTEERDVWMKKGEVDVLVENMGKNNGADYYWHKTGLVDEVSLNGQHIQNWKITTFNLENITSIPLSCKLPTGCPAIYKGTFYVDEPADTFFNPTGLSKGNLFINGLNLGRYWYPKRPQLTLYVPKHLLQKGTNELIVFNSDPLDRVPEVSLDAVHNLEFQVEIISNDLINNMSQV